MVNKQRNKLKSQKFQVICLVLIISILCSQITICLGVKYQKHHKHKQTKWKLSEYSNYWIPASYSVVNYSNNPNKYQKPAKFQEAQQKFKTVSMQQSGNPGPWLIKPIHIPLDVKMPEQAQIITMTVPKPNTSAPTKDPPKSTEKATDCNTDSYSVFLEDLNYISYFLDVGLTITGILCILIEIFTQTYANISTTIIDFPSIILPIIFNNNIPTNLNNLLTFLSTFDSIVNVIFMNPLANQLKLLAIILEFLGFVSLSMNTILLFPQTTKLIVKKGFGLDLNVLFRSYCYKQQQQQRRSSLF